MVIPFISKENSLYRNTMDTHADSGCPWTHQQQMTIRQVATILNVSEKFVYSICKKGLLESFKVGNRIRVPKEGLQRYLHANKNGVSHLPVTTPRTQLKRLRFR